MVTYRLTNQLWPLPVLAMLGSAFGAVAGYNLFRDQGRQSAHLQRIGLPSIALTPSPTATDKHPAIQAQLLSWRF